MKNKILSLFRYIRFILTYLVVIPHPVNSKKYFFISMSGKSYGGNPKAFSDYLRQRDGAISVWAFEDLPQVLSDTNIVLARLYTFKYYYQLLTSKYIISDQRLYKPMMPAKRKGQKYIQTWHGTALKKIEADMPLLTDNYKQGAIRDSKNTDLIVSGSEFMSKIYSTSFWYKGEILNGGTPRNDLFFKSNDIITLKEKVYRELGISPQKKLVLYAPTFRHNAKMDAYCIDGRALISALGNSYVFALRLHPNLMNPGNRERVKHMFPYAIDATRYPDMQELLCVTDVLITDYSSSMFDYMLTKKPCFVFATDIDTYDRGYYMSIYNLPFPVAADSDQLISNIKQFDETRYQNDITSFISKIGNYEQGLACENLYNYICSTWE